MCNSFRGFITFTEYCPKKYKFGNVNNFHEIENVARWCVSFCIHGVRTKWCFSFIQFHYYALFSFLFIDLEHASSNSTFQSAVVRNFRKTIYDATKRCWRQKNFRRRQKSLFESQCNNIKMSLWCATVIRIFSPNGSKTIEKLSHFPWRKSYEFTCFSLLHFKWSSYVTCVPLMLLTR